MTAKNNKNKSIKAKIGLLNFHATLPFNKVQKYAKMPTQGTWRSVRYDLYSVENTSILPNTQKLIPTGIACNLPRKMFGLIKDRSSIITKRELKTQAGVTDEDYIGQIFVSLRTIGKEERQISIGERIAQIILLDYKLVKWIETDNIAQTKRGEKCFGSTGTN